MLRRLGSPKCVESETEIASLEAEKKSIDQKIQAAEDKIKNIMKNCKHKADPTTLDHYVTYCMHCGYGMDTWL